MAASGGGDPRLSGLNVYPIKSARGIALEQSDLDNFGLRYDRRWMVIDESGEFISQRRHPRMALVQPTIQDSLLRVDAPEMPTLELPLNPSPAVSTSVTVWDDKCEAAWLGEQAAQWFSRYLQDSCSLVHMAASTLRPADRAYAPEGTRVSFADAFPFLLISQASLEDLNGRMTEPLPMNRFRPNLVITGTGPYEEDGWLTIQIGEVPFRIVKPCARCLVTTTDQTTGKRGREPLRTLGTYRNVNGKVMFGQNAVHDRPGRLQVGDPVRVGERTPPLRSPG